MKNCVIALLNYVTVISAKYNTVIRISLKGAPLVTDSSQPDRFVTPAADKI